MAHRWLLEESHFLPVIPAPHLLQPYQLLFLNSCFVPPPLCVWPPPPPPCRLTGGGGGGYWLACGGGGGGGDFCCVAVGGGWSSDVVEGATDLKSCGGAMVEMLWGRV
jgi:hypothetical protein